MDAMKVEENTEANSVDAAKERNETLTTELHFELLKQYAWLASAMIGVVIVLVQLKAMTMGFDVYVTLGVLGVSIFFCLFGQDHIVDSLLNGKDIYKIAKVLKFYRGVALTLLGFGSGFMTTSVVKALS